MARGLPCRSLTRRRTIVAQFKFGFSVQPAASLLEGSAHLLGVIDAQRLALDGFGVSRTTGSEETLHHEGGVLDDLFR